MMSPETNTILNSLVERLHVEVEDDLMGRIFYPEPGAFEAAVQWLNWKIKRLAAVVDDIAVPDAVRAAALRERLALAHTRTVLMGEKPNLDKLAPILADVDGMDAGVLVGLLVDVKAGVLREAPPAPALPAAELEPEPAAAELEPEPVKMPLADAVNGLEVALNRDDFDDIHLWGRRVVANWSTD